MAKGPNAFRTISEAAEELGVPQHVLRFWETKFSFIRPMKRAGGRRFYRPQDIVILRGVHVLLHQEGYTIKGVQKLHKEQGVKHLAAAGTPSDEPMAELPSASDTPETPSDATDLAPESRERLEHALSDLEAVKARLDSLLKGS